MENLILANNSLIQLILILIIWGDENRAFSVHIHLFWLLHGCGVPARVDGP
jgi:hypothetical protein